MMKFKGLFLICFLSACGRMDAFELSDSQFVHIDSNVVADVFMGSKRLGTTPFYGEIPRGLTTSLRLEKAYYQTIDVPLRTVARRDICASRSFDEVYATFFFIPTTLDITGFSRGQWVEYIPNTYYVELVPDFEQHSFNQDVKAMYLRSLALTIYPDVILGNAEALRTLSFLTGQSTNVVYTQALSSSDAISFMRQMSRYYSANSLK